ncbi:AMP-binding protein [Pseudomonas sessilinigenes]|uniref:AMP-binding protein n=1 Tax=Pseudomonas sessilinigenes TaxID=658629 RepID=A0ABX8MXN0_9PSED|nr:AMP-binding protein [Pseudomonas sessilinigenes]AZC24467.1 Polyketide synthase [Pseudomonas sessilinigenes]QXH43403.1 AMP-binding protein [Pseudomonas sessilinigenes]
MPISLAQVLACHADSKPDQVAFRFLDTQGTEVDSPTYGELARQVAGMAGGLRARGVLPGQPIVLGCNSPAQFIRGFLAIVHAGAVAVPVPLNGRRRGRLEHVLADCQPFALVLGSETPALARFCDSVPATRLIAVDEVFGESIAPFAADAQDTCFIQYTSGSTSAPKGVVVTHGQLAANSRMIATVFSHDSHTRFASWLPLFHDMGLVGAALHPLLIGAEAVLMPTEAFQECPERWLRMISDYRAHTSGAPDFAYRICASIDDPHRLHGIDLSSWRVAYNGAEPVKAATLERFAAAMQACRFDPAAWLPCYGLAETTLLSAGHRQRSPAVGTSLCPQALATGHAQLALAGQPARVLVSSGTVAPGADIRIVDPNSLNPLPEGRIGEIWVAGEHVASRYWGRADGRFGVRLAGDSSTDYLRTADLGFFLGNELYVTGRLNDLLIVAGRNIYPDDIEETARGADPLLSEARMVALALTGEQFDQALGLRSCESWDSEQLVLLVELPTLAPARSTIELAQAIARACEHPLAAIVWVARAQISMTTSGKIQRAEARRKLLANDYKVRGVWLSPTLGDGLDAALACLAGTLGARGTAVAIGAALAQVAALAANLPQAPAVETSLLALGLNSLAATELFARISHITAIHVPLAILYDGWTLAELGRWLRDQSAMPPSRLPSSVPEPTLRAGQRSILQRRVERGDGAYSLALAVTGTVSAIDRLVARAADLPNRLPALGMRVLTTATGPEVVFAQAHSPAAVARLDSPVQARFALLRSCCSEPFELAKGPLRLVRASSKDDPGETLLVQVHHAAVDFWSMLWIARYLLLPASGKPRSQPLAPRAASEADLGYWRTELASFQPTVLPKDFRSDRPQPPHCIPFSLDHAAFERLLQASGQTPFVTLLTCVFAVLGRLSGHWDRVIGVPINDDLGERPGYGTRVAPVRAELAADQSFVKAARHIGFKLGRCFVHASASLEQIGSQLRQVRSDTAPLFEVAAVHVAAVSQVPDQWQRLILRDERSQVVVGDLTLSSSGLGPEALEQPIEIVSCETANGVEGVVRVDASAFSNATARQIGLRLERMICAAAQGPEQSLQALVDQAAERGWQTTPRLDHAPATLPALISAWALARPDSVAIQSAQQTLTYRQLEERSDRLARQILQQWSPTLVAVRSGDPIPWLVGLLAGLKTGAAIMPLDARLPSKRQEALLATSGSDLLLESLADEALWLPVAKDARLGCQVSATLVTTPRLLPKAAPRDSAYLVFTSGSSGQPKGVRQSHQAFSHYLQWQVSALGMGPGARVAQIAAPGFDVALCEIFGGLCHGASLVLPDRTADLAPDRLLQWLDETAVTSLQITPSLLAEALRCSAIWPRRLQVLATVGEPLPASLATELLRRGGTDLQLINLYGPTETVAACWHRVTLADLERVRIPVGQPICGRTVEIRDADGLPVPIGSLGEIYLRTADMSDGYDGAAQEGGFVLLASQSTDGRGLYRTGDMGRWNTDGLLEVIGRRDNQVKLNGVRIELEEVESVLCLYPGVHAAIASLRPLEAGPQLIAHVEVQDAVTPQALRRFALERLPLTAVPSLIVTVAELPRTRNGKLDRRAVAALALPTVDLACAPAAPLPELLRLQQAIALLWQEVLPHEGVPAANSDFFAAGGHSIHAMQLLNLLKTRTGIAIGLAQFLAEPTVAALASLVHSQLTPTPCVEVH